MSESRAADSRAAVRRGPRGAFAVPFRLALALLFLGWAAAQPAPTLTLGSYAYVVGETLELAAANLEPGASYRVELTPPGEGDTRPAPLVSVLWVLGMANAVNLIDGLDGLAAGIVAIAAGSFFLYGHKLATVGVEVIGPDNPSPLIAVIIAGVCLGFLPWNFNPARIFMGDGGALMLGGLMAASTMLVGGQTSQTFSGQVYFFFAPLFIPFFVMGVPIIDTAFAIIRRARKRVGVAEADKDHLHHRLMRLGHGHIDGMYSARPGPQPSQSCYPRVPV